MSETPPTIDFHRIRPYDGSHSGGFEQLAVELFARAHGLTRQLVRVNGAGGDGGVEAYAEVAGKGKLGMQAKFFDELKVAQWRQIDKSVKAALDQHPDMKEYHVYMSLDRTKGRKGKTKGQVEKWDKHVEDWHNLPNGADVEFIWQGKFEIELALKDPANRDLLFYWFGTPQFDDAWLNRLLQASLKTLGDRYQPDRHVGATVGRELDRIVWSPSADRELEEAYVKFAESAISFTERLEGLTMPDGHEDRRAIVQRDIDEVFHIGHPEYRVRTADQVYVPAQTLLEHTYELDSCLREQHVTSKADPDKYQQHSINIFARAIREWVDCLDRYREADHQCVLVRGDAGSGKSHLLAHCAVQARARNQPAILVLGEQFLDSQPPLVQLCQQVGWNGGADSLLMALNVAGSIAARPALLFIDALNESDQRRLWKSHLHLVAEEVRKYPHVRLVVSCRSDFVGITMPDGFKTGVPDNWGLIEHRGLGDVLAEVVARYFASYNIQSQHFPPLLDEFRNPLFLDTFCRAFENQSLPAGPITLQTVMERRITRLAEKIQQDIDCDEHHVRKAILALAKKICSNNGFAITETAARAAIEPHSPSTEQSRSLYTHLLSNGVIVERIDRYWEDDSPVVVRFAFERFSDYFIAQGILEDVANVVALQSLVQQGGRLGWLRAWETYSDNRGVARALTVLVPERYGIELVDVLPAEIEHRGVALTDLMDSLLWRSGTSITGSTETLLFEASRYGSAASFVEALLRLSTIPDHPFNARFLHDLLSAMTLPKRDATWTLPVAQLASDVGTVPSSLVEWAIQVPRELVSDEQAALVATVLLWLGSSNRVAFRSQAGLAAIRILRGRPHITRDLVDKFDAVNDPYVVERVYAVACGVAMREPAGEGLRELASTVHRLVFSTAEVRPHVLLRDYARALLEAAAYRDCLDEDIASQSYRPPYVSRWPSIIDEAEAQQIENDQKWWRIVSSVRPESMGGYGDFGRYVMGNAVGFFYNARRNEAIPSEKWGSRFDDRQAYRWVLQRVKELGWTSKLFGEHDDRSDDKRITGDEYKIERIGKKYQWIALHELLGYVSDANHMCSGWSDEPRTYEGAWQICQRDFDPSAEPSARPTVYEEDVGRSQVLLHRSAVQWEYADPYPNLFKNLELLADRSAWVREQPHDPISLLSAQRADDPHRWLVLDGYWSWKEPRILRIRHGWDGRSEMWIHARSWLVKKCDAEGFIDRISKRNFWGHGIRGVSLGDGWIGEYPYGAAFKEIHQYCEEPDALTGRDSAMHVRTTCDWDRRDAAIVPSPKLCDVLELRWSGEVATFVDPAGTVIATQAPLPDVGETAPCVVNAERLRAGLNRKDLEIVWGIVGERRCWNGKKMAGDVETHFSGVYRLSNDDGLSGGLTVTEVVELPSSPSSGSDIVF